MQCQCSEKLPILGICGAPNYRSVFEQKLLNAKIMHGKVDTIKHYGHPIFKNIKNFKQLGIIL